MVIDEELDLKRNVLQWYPIKENSTILQIGFESYELIDEMCKKAEKVTLIVNNEEQKENILQKTKYENLEIIVEQNLEKIEQEYDYISLIGTIKIYQDILEEKAYKRLQKLLKIANKICKETGKILLTVDNKYGMKFWTTMYAQKNILCNQKFALSKTMIEQLLKEENLTNYKFYYMLPDYKITNVMDKWIISKLNTLIKEVDDKLNEYNITAAALEIEEFTDTLSNWYVRRNRERFWAQELNDEKIGAYVTLYKVLTNLSKVIAPFVPFMAEEIYQNLVVGLDKTAPESVHLCLWPEVEESAIDQKLEQEMDLAYKIVKLGRSARNAANIKNRQPLSEMLISVDTLPEYYAHIVKEELNVKKIELGAEMSDYVNFEIKPNLPVLGKEYGKLIPKIKEEIAKKNQMELATTVKAGKVEYIEIDGTEIGLDANNLLITMHGKEGFAFSGEGEMGVVLDTHITPELKEEGYVREILSKVQNMRKDSGFKVLDRINLYVAENAKLEDVIKKFEANIKHDTLADNIIYDEPNKDYIDTNINGENLKIFVEVI